VTGRDRRGSQARCRAAGPGPSSNRAQVADGWARARAGRAVAERRTPPRAAGAGLWRGNAPDGSRLMLRDPRRMIAARRCRPRGCCNAKLRGGRGGNRVAQGQGHGDRGGAQPHEQGDTRHERERQRGQKAGWRRQRHPRSPSTARTSGHRCRCVGHERAVGVDSASSLTSLACSTTIPVWRPPPLREPDHYIDGDVGILLYRGYRSSSWRKNRAFRKSPPQKKNFFFFFSFAAVGRVAECEREEGGRARSAQAHHAAERSAALR